MRTTPVAGPPGPPAPRGANEPAPPDETGGFPALLTETEARTAPAEGPKTAPEHDDRPGQTTEATPVAAADTATAPAAREPRAAVAAAATPVSPAVPADAQDTATAATSTPAGPTAPAPATGTTPVAVTTTISAPALAAGAPTVPGVATPVPATVPDPAAGGAAGGAAPAITAGEGTAAGGVPTTAARMHAAAPDADDLPRPTTAPAAAPAATADAAGAAPASATPARPADTATPVAGPVPATAAPAGAATDAPHPSSPAGSGAPAAAATTPASAPAVTAPPVPAATPAAPATPGAPSAWLSGGLVHTAERLADLAHVATANGVARARLQLHPQELGGIEVRLRQSAEGLVATITATRADGLEALQQTAGDLRRSLEERGVPVARLDLSLAAHGDGHRPWERRTADLAAGAGGRRGADDAAANAVENDTDPTPTTAPRTGALVDVHA